MYPVNCAHSRAMNQCFSVYPYGFLSKMVLSPWVLLIPYASLYVPTHQLESLKIWSCKFLLLLHCRPKVLDRNQLWRIWREVNASVSSFCSHLFHVISNVYWGIIHDDVEALHIGILVHETHCILQEKHLVAGGSNPLQHLLRLRLFSPASVVDFDSLRLHIGQFNLNIHHAHNRDGPLEWYDWLHELMVL